MAAMRLLLDTCIVYDWLMGTITDKQTIDRIVTQGALVSPVSVWEMAIKHGLGKMHLPSPQIAADIEAQGFQWLNINPYHTQTVLQLAGHHKDPFDRMLVAQATYEGLSIVTYDAIFQCYLDQTLIVRH
jgi:PIN domain nuclease of toxin-antitoxin system